MDMGLALNLGGRLNAAAEPVGAEPVRTPGEAAIPDQDTGMEVRALLAEKLLMEVDSVDADLLQDGSLDSLTLIQLLLLLEERFGVRLALDEMEIDDFRSIRSITRMLATQKRASQQTGKGN